MDYDRFGRWNMRGKQYGSVTGTVVEMMPAANTGRGNKGCMMFVSVEDEDGNLTVFLVTPSTYVLDYVRITNGMKGTFWYDTNAPVPLIFPPQYNAVAVAEEIPGRNVDVGYYNNSLVNDSQTLKLNLDASTEVVTVNNQIFSGSPAGNNLMVVYDITTRSIPAQTTPSKIVVLCDRG